jgi:outer membrane protein W
MHKKLMTRLVVVFCSLFSFSFVHGEAGDFAVGVNYPGIGARYFLSDKVSLELKIQSEQNILAAGLRGYYYLKPSEKLLPFIGLELDYITFQGDYSKGTGTAGEFFVGAEHFINKKISIQMDIGIGLVTLNDTATSESVNGAESIVNFGINYYFGK